MGLGLRRRNIISGAATVSLYSQSSHIVMTVSSVEMLLPYETDAGPLLWFGLLL
jgi:hypothetical protein